MKLGIISDVHDNLRATTKALEFFKKNGIEMLVHMGDWVSPFTMRAFTKIEVPIKSVLGNGDPDIQKFQYQLQNLEDLKTLKLDIHERFHDFMFDNKRIAVFHGNDDDLNKFIIESQLFDVFCVGHSHIPKIEKNGKTLIVNSGSMVGWMLDKGDLPRTVAIYDSDLNEAKLFDIETGKESL